jgi:hypothetical protein
MANFQSSTFTLDELTHRSIGVQTEPEEGNYHHP